jgi:hypothetical protein
MCIHQLENNTEYLNVLILFTTLWNFYLIIKLSTMRAGEYVGVGGRERERVTVRVRTPWESKE